MKFRTDLLERAGWTAAQAAAATVAVTELGLPEWAIVPVAGALAVVKAFLARKVGDPDTASTVREPDTRGH